MEAARPVRKEAGRNRQNGNSGVLSGAEELCLRVQQRSVSRATGAESFSPCGGFHAAKRARLVQTLQQGDVFEAVAEIIANLMGSEEVAIFQLTYPPPRLFFPGLVVGLGGQRTSTI